MPPTEPRPYESRPRTAGSARQPRLTPDEGQERLVDLLKLVPADQDRKAVVARGLAQRRPATSVKGQQAVPRRGEIAAMPSAEQRVAELVERAGAPPA